MWEDDGRRPRAAAPRRREKRSGAWNGRAGQKRGIGIMSDSPTLGGGDAVEAVEQAAQAERRAIVVLFLVLRRRRLRRGCGDAGRGVVARDATGERSVEIFKKEDASVGMDRRSARCCTRARSERPQSHNVAIYRHGAWNTNLEGTLPMSVVSVLSLMLRTASAVSCRLAAPCVDASYPFEDRLTT